VGSERPSFRQTRRSERRQGMRPGGDLDYPGVKSMQHANGRSAPSIVIERDPIVQLGHSG
jgi:hypothetical protein